MKPERNAKRILGITRAVAKMLEYDVPEQYRLKIEEDLTMLLDLTIGILGDACATSMDQSEQGIIGSLSKNREQVLFSSFYFDALLNSRVNDAFLDYVKLLGASAYYLCDFPGSSRVLVSQIGDLDLDAEGLERFVRALLTHGFSDDLVQDYRGRYQEILQDLHARLSTFFQEGGDEQAIIRSLGLLVEQAYAGGGDRELLFADVARTLCLKKVGISTWKTLPEFSSLPKELWKTFIQKPDAIYELWPAQLLLGERGVFAGRSAVVQMPTSAGKTRATELIIRSALLGGRTKLAIIVAPYRALCHEIYDALAKQFRGEEIDLELASDVLQEDLGDTNEQRARILILTPEKLDYLLRQKPELAEQTRLIIYDEGHLFDDSTRGVKYELLLGSLPESVSASGVAFTDAADM